MASRLARQLFPLLLNPVSQEPYLRLPSPHENIIITPPRIADAHIVTEYLNDPKVHETLEGPPHPYLLEHADFWLNMVKKECDDILEELYDAAEKDSDPIFVNGCPVRSIREVKEDGSDVFIGDIGILRARRFSHYRDGEKEAQLLEKNKSLPVGDPEIVWEIANYLGSNYHGRGIMSVALRTLVNEWAIPRMNAKTIFGLAFKGNRASVRVFEKNGFTLLDTVDDIVEIKESKGGGKAGLHFLERRVE